MGHWELGLCLPITVCDDIMNLNVIGLDGYEPKVTEVIGAIEMQLMAYFVQNSTKRIEDYLKAVKKSSKVPLKKDKH